MALTFLSPLTSDMSDFPFLNLQSGLCSQPDELLQQKPHIVSSVQVLEVIFYIPLVKRKHYWHISGYCSYQVKHIAVCYSYTRSSPVSQSRLLCCLSIVSLCWCYYGSINCYHSNMLCDKLYASIGLVCILRSSVVLTPYTHINIIIIIHHQRWSATAQRCPLLL